MSVKSRKKGKTFYMTGETKEVKKCWNPGKSRSRCIETQGNRAIRFQSNGQPRYKKKKSGANRCSPAININISN